MLTPFLWTAEFGPLALMTIALAPAKAASASRRVQFAAGFTLLSAIVALAAVAGLGRLETGTLGLRGIGFGLYLDPFGAAMFALVAFIGLVVIGYSRNYLHGDPGHARFMRLLGATLASVLLLILSGNLLQTWLAWVAASLTLHRLLRFYPERRAGVFAARKKQIASRLGDVALVVAIALIYAAVGSLDYRTVLAAPPSATTSAAAVFVALAALTKSGQFPLHGWLLEVMETPTPVSALLHAGVINAGGFLVLRLSPLMASSPAALHLLLAVGAITALVGSAIMLPQTAVKGGLACSTVAQMGFMMLECGLGVFSASALHILAHSLYKAHAFLSSGNAVNLKRGPAKAPAPPARRILAIAFAPALVAGGALLIGEGARQPGVVALGAILALGLAPMFADAAGERPKPAVAGALAGVAVLVVAGYFALQKLAAAVFASSLAPTTTGGFGDWLAAGLVVAAFAALAILQALLPILAPLPTWRALRAHVASGFYVNTFVNRQLLRLWPTGAAPHTF
jgi:NAD(P)H-quinone oxidoreductase subunit 5